MEKALEDIGLTKGEVKVYLTLLTIGETTTGKIIEEAQISAGKIYQILDKLIKKGLAGYIIKNKTKYFNSTHPNRILDLLQKKEEEIKNREKEINKLLPSMIKRYKSTKQETETVLFKGLNGIQTAIFETLGNLNSNDEILAMGLQISKKEKYNLLWEKWHRKRIKKRINCKCLFSEIKDNTLLFLKKANFTEIKLLKGISPSAIAIVGDTLLIQTYKEEPSCLVIKNPDIAESFKYFFNTLWQSAKKL